MQRLLRAVRGLAFLYDLGWVLALVAFGVGIAVAGVLTDRIAMVPVGVAVTLLAVAWLAFDVWPGRTSGRGGATPSDPSGWIDPP
jgi:hypothetical protein